jgi:hypothetical protein
VDAIRHAQTAAEAEYGHKLRVLCTDNGGEFTVATARMRVFNATTLRRTTHSRTASSSGATRRLWRWIEPSSSRGECLLSSREMRW